MTGRYGSRHQLEAFRTRDDLFPLDPSDTDAEPYYRGEILAEYLNISPQERAIYTNSDLLATWPELYGYPTLKLANGNLTNTANATLTIPSQEAVAFKAGDVCRYFDVSENALSTETRTISAINATTTRPYLPRQWPNFLWATLSRLWN